MKQISIIIPCYRTGKKILPLLEQLVLPTANGLVKQVVLADGANDDMLKDIADQLGADYISVPKGRGLQQKIAVIYAKAEWLLFLHDDSEFSEGWDKLVEQFIENEAHNKKAAYFKFALNDKGLRAKLLSVMVNLRCKLFALPYGDQGLLIKRDFYEEIGGFNSYPLMEDVDMIERIKAAQGRASLINLPIKLITDAARFKNGYLKRNLRNLSILFQYKMGTSPDELVKKYQK